MFMGGNVERYWRKRADWVNKLGDWVEGPGDWAGLSGEDALLRLE
jgi:hypothetical protein